MFGSLVSDVDKVLKQKS